MDRKWLMGFIEGSGCFSVVIRKSNNQVGYQTTPDFTVKLPASHKALLEDIQRFLGVGKVYESGREAMLKVTKIDDAKRLSDFFGKEEFLTEAKRTEFAVWKKCVQLISEGAQHTAPGILEIAKLRDSIHMKPLWNKKNFCSLRAELDPCHIYQDTKQLPPGCRICWTPGEKLVPPLVQVKEAN